MRDGTLDYRAGQSSTSLDKKVLFDPAERVRMRYASRKNERSLSGEYLLNARVWDQQGTVSALGPFII